MGFLKYLRETGHTDVRYLMQLGILDPRWILIHCIHCTELDIEHMARVGASCVEVGGIRVARPHARVRAGRGEHRRRDTSTGAQVHDLQGTAGVERFVPGEQRHRRHPARRELTAEGPGGGGRRSQRPGAYSRAPARAGLGGAADAAKLNPVEIARAPAHHRVAGREVLVLDRDGRTTTLDGLAADVWTMLSEPADPTDIEAALADAADLIRTCSTPPVRRCR